MTTAPRPRPRPVRLADIAALIGRPLAPEWAGVDVTGVTLDSRDVRPGDLYAALPGHHTHGARFADAARGAGAVAILTDAEGAGMMPAPALPVLVVERPRNRLGAVASTVYGDPAAALQLIGITGTNGKTTVSAMVESGLRAGGRTTGMIGTTGVVAAGRTFAGARTTPEAPDLHAILGVMRDAHVDTVVMEVSSIAIAEGRVDGIVYDIAAFTNLSQDHLDYHGSMEDYYAAKAELFTPGRARLGIIGVDDLYGARLARECRIPVETWSAVNPDADWVLAWGTGRGSVIDADGRLERIDLRMPGAFNEANAVCAFAVLRRAGIPAAQAAEGIASATVPGRMQVVGSFDGVMGIVDYAHSPDAIDRVLASLAASAHGRVIAVVGAGGDRDRTKRPQMGAIAAALADVLIITDDNPRSEDPAAIRAAVRAGALEVATAERADVREEADRARAITVAVSVAEAGDVVVVLGKGHEQGQDVAGVISPFDDAEVLTAALHVRTST